VPALDWLRYCDRKQMPDESLARVLTSKSFEPRLSHFTLSNADCVNALSLRNVIEEMAIAAGVHVPKISVLDDDAGINAFATRHTPGETAINVTRGCLTMLTCDEIKGVIGHQFSHILNGDMRLNLRIMGVVFGVLCLAVVG